MQLLRASSQALGEGADLAATVGRGDGGVPHGEELARFAEAATLKAQPTLARFEFRNRVTS